MGSTSDEPRINVLMDREERKEYVKDNKERFALAAKRSKLKTLNTMTKRSAQLFDKIFHSFDDLTEEIVRNVIAYVKCLPAPGTEIIDQNIFDAQLKRHFNLTNDLLLERMYKVCRLDERDPRVFIDEFIELICIFLSEIRDLKIQFVFRVYNARGDGFLNRKDLEYFIIPMFNKVRELSDEDYGTSLKDFVDMLVGVCDKNGDNQIELDEFRDLAADSVLMLECLGPCLPSEIDRIQFLGLIQGRTRLETSALFRFERRVALREPILIDKNGIQRFYPVDLELP